jgi:hypothetical protein
MKLLLLTICWCLLLILCWPLALLVLLLFPLIWLICLPFRIAGAVIQSVFRLIFGLLMLPFRLFGYGRSQGHG